MYLELITHWKLYFCANENNSLFVFASLNVVIQVYCSIFMRYSHVFLKKYTYRYDHQNDHTWARHAHRLLLTRTHLGTENAQPNTPSCPLYACALFSLLKSLEARLTKKHLLTGRPLTRSQFIFSTAFSVLLCHASTELLAVHGRAAKDGQVGCCPYRVAPHESLAGPALAGGMVLLRGPWGPPWIVVTIGAKGFYREHQNHKKNNI